MFVNELMDRYGVRRSGDPRQCTYFVRLNRAINLLRAKMEEHSSAVIASVTFEAGKQRVGLQTYLDNGREQRAWSNDLFEAIYIPVESRVIAPPLGLDVAGLIEVIQKQRLVVADGIRTFEHERAYLEDRMQAAGVQV